MIWFSLPQTDHLLEQYNTAKLLNSVVVLHTFMKNQVILHVTSDFSNFWQEAQMEGKIRFSTAEAAEQTFILSMFCCCLCSPQSMDCVRVLTE